MIAVRIDFYFFLIITESIEKVTNKRDAYRVPKSKDIPMMAPQCIFEYGSSPVRISHKTIPKEKTSTYIYPILVTYQAQDSLIPVDASSLKKILPSQILGCCYHSTALVPSREECPVHLQKPKCCT
jgi:hypothetical protein